MLIYYYIIVLLLVLLIVLLEFHNIELKNVVLDLISAQNEIKNLVSIIPSPSEETPLPESSGVSWLSGLFASLLFSFIFMGWFYFDFGHFENLRILIESQNEGLMEMFIDNSSLIQSNLKDVTNCLLSVLEKMQLSHVDESSKILQKLNSMHLKSPALSENIEALNRVNLKSMMEDTD